MSTYFYDGGQLLIENLLKDGEPVLPVVKAPKEHSPYNFAQWGTGSNDRPDKVKTDLEANPVLGSALKLRKAVHYGKGLAVYREDINEQGKASKVLVKDLQVIQLLRNSDYRRTQPGFISDHEVFGNIFPVMVLGTNGKIAQVRRVQAFQSRWSKMGEDGYIEKLMISADWIRRVAENKPVEILALDHLYPMLDLQDRVKKDKKNFLYALPTRIMEQGQVYYDIPAWDGLREGWLKMAYQIPRLKQAILKNQMRIRYHVQIPYNYYQKRFKDWDTHDQATREESMKTVQTDLNKWLTGYENAGKTFISHFEYDMALGKEFPGIKITPLQDSFKEGEGLMDASAANTEILWALQVDPILIGVLPGTSQQGSGSSKREAFQILQHSMTLDREATLYPWRFAMEFNGMDPELEIGYRDVDLSETLNENPTGKKEVL